MRIAYLLERDISRDDAVVKKTAAQCAVWCQSGNVAKIFALSAGNGLATALQNVDVDVESWQRWRDWWTSYPNLVDRIIRWQPDMVYFRFSLYFPALGRLMREIPTVVEINTNDLTEYRRNMNFKAYAYHRISRSRLFRRAHGLVTVTSELADAYRTLGKPIAVVPNGIDLDAVPPLPAPNNERPQLVFLGQGRKPWHGVDKIVRLAELFPDWDFDLIGDESFGFETTPPNVRCFPFMDAGQYQIQLARADVALGSLAMHRNSMHEASPLKVREYLARGLPTITAYKDPDFPGAVPFLLELPNTTDNVESSRDRIVEFVRQARGMRVPRDAIRHLDYSEKERLRIEFFDRLLRGRQTSHVACGT